ncbi:(Fe-S)-binding protein [Pseudidiomarina aestuarii]|uniref:(Fe-S)-binding protein n=1 Tax=Pseudidiomarina aestuarii TaxID=624146 RepID=A0A7Z6ZTI9_9GAMM|nr:class I ribonucleotide reductase maintenance protein YfaE [Pseudidiomarina aestuarii]RUO40982.1 (Fe-S)-binding protein [Pseudidiomarina aestuarii]
MTTTFRVKVNGQHELTVDPSEGTLLEAMEAANIDTHYHCRDGFCGACRTKLVSGDVYYINEPLAFVRPGDCLPCCCVPASDLDLDH